MKVMTPPFPISGAGVLAFEAVIGGALIGLYWTAYPAGFAKVGAITAALLLANWGLAWSTASKVRANEAGKLETRARVFLILGAVFGVLGLVLGVLGGPHLGGAMVYGFIAQFLALLIGRIAIAI